MTATLLHRLNEVRDGYARRRALWRELDAYTTADDLSDLEAAIARHHRLEAAAHPARLNARKVEQRIHQLQEPERVAVHKFQTLMIVWRETVRARQDVVQRSQDQRKGRSQLMADVAEENCLHAVDFGQRLVSSALQLIGTCVGDHDGDLS